MTAPRGRTKHCTVTPSGIVESEVEPSFVSVAVPGEDEVYIEVIGHDLSIGQLSRQDGSLSTITVHGHDNIDALIDALRIARATI